MGFFNTMNITGTALTAQQLRMDILSQNMTNVDTTRTAEGGPYKRKAAVFQERGNNGTFLSALMQAKGAETRVRGNGVVVAEIVTDDSQGPMVYDPSHPDANAEGYVEKPNVNIVTEMVNMISASRSYEANVTAMSVTKSMIAKTFELLR